MDPCLVLLACAPGPTGRAPAAQLTLPVPLQGDNGEGDLDCAGSPGLPGPPGLPGQRGEEVRPVPGLVRAGQGGCGLLPSVPRGQFHSCQTTSKSQVTWHLSWLGVSHSAGTLAALGPGDALLPPQAATSARSSFPPSTLCSEITFSGRPSLTS